MIDVAEVTFAYGSHGAMSADDAVTGVRGVSLHVEPGECLLLCGASGCGKSTVLRLLNGLVPHFHPGELTGGVRVCGLEVSTEPLDVTGQRVATVFQNPRTQFFASRVRDELAFGPENFGTDPDAIRSRSARAARTTGIEELLDSNVFQLSGGQKQLVACTAAMVAEPGVYLFDEPTSNLSRESVARLRRVMLDLRTSGATMVIAEHRLSYLRGIIDRAIVLDGGRIVEEMPAQRLWSMSRQERVDRGLRRLSPVAPSAPALVLHGADPTTGIDECTDEGLVIEDLRFSYGSHRVIGIERLVLPRGRVTAIVGPNGAGKSTLTRILVGLERARGSIRLDGRQLRTRDRTRLGYVVMQDVHRQLFAAEVREELTLGASSRQARPERIEEVLAEHDLAELAGRHPMSLSGGQKQRLVIAAAQMVDKQVYVFDEPSSGLDHRHVSSTARTIRSLARAGKVVVVITHDEELLAACADRTVEMLPLSPSGSSPRGSRAEIYP